MIVRKRTMGRICLLNQKICNNEHISIFCHCNRAQAEYTKKSHVFIDLFDLHGPWFEYFKAALFLHPYWNVTRPIFAF